MVGGGDAGPRCAVRHSGLQPAGRRAARHAGCRDMTAPILEIKGLNVGFTSYGRTSQVLHGIDLTVETAQRAAIIGESGSGKTVTMKTVIGTLPHPAGRVLGGSIRFAGQELLTLGRREREKLKGTDISI